MQNNRMRKRRRKSVKKTRKLESKVREQGPWAQKREGKKERKRKKEKERKT